VTTQWIHVDTDKAKDGPFGPHHRARLPHPVLLPVFSAQIYNIDNVKMAQLRLTRCASPPRAGEQPAARAASSCFGVARCKGGVQVSHGHSWNRGQRAPAGVRRVGTRAYL